MKKEYIFKIIRIIGRLVYRKKVWLVSDREMEAGDNGEAFFEYLQDKNVHAVFAISRRTPDYLRLQKVGHVVDYGSLRYLFLLCVSEVYLSSQEHHMKNHKETISIFLQHGVTNNDVHNYINPLCHDNFYIVASTREEEKSFSMSPYCLDKSHILLTGMPRYDKLRLSEKQKIITIAFTWRLYLYDVDETSFMESSYFKILNGILTSDELDKLLESTGYRMEVKLHPQIMRYKRLFKFGKNVSECTDSYTEMFNKTALLISDYSSVVFDFAYLRKPLIFHHEDYEEYVSRSKGSNKESSYDYERDGFGVVVDSLPSLIEELHRYIKGGCMLEEKYEKRIDEFFAFNDQNNSERLFETVKNIIEKGKL